MTLVKVDVDSLRAVASGLSSTADTVEDLYFSMRADASQLSLSAASLNAVPDHVQDLRDESDFASAKADWIVLINSGDSGTTQDTGEISVEVPGEEPSTLMQLEFALGVAIADLGTSIASSDHEEGDPRIGALNDYLIRWGDNATVTTALFNNLGPDGTLAVTQAIGDHVGFTYRADEEESRTAQTTLRNFKSALEKATQAWTPTHARTFGQDLVTASEHPDPDSDYYELGTRTESLAWLLYDADNASDAFTQGAAEAMEEIEQARTANGYPGSWGWTGPSRFLPAMCDEADEDWALDVPSVIMHDLGTHPNAAHGFFTGDENRVQYWAGEHPYQGDLSGIAAAIDAASTYAPLRSTDPQGTASIAALGLEALTSRDGFGTERDQQGTEGAQSLGHILETYMPSVVDAYANGNNTTDRPGGAMTYTLTDAVGNSYAHCPWFSAATLDSALGVVGRDGQAMLDLRAAVNTAEANALPVDGNHEHLALVADAWGATEGGIANAIGTGGIAEAQSNDAYALAWIELANKPASTLAGLATAFAPPGTGPGAAWASDALVGSLKDAATEAFASSDKDAKVGANDAADAAYSAFVLRLLFASDAAGLNGYQDPASGEVLEDLGAATVERPDGSFRLVTETEYQSLPPLAQAEARSALRSMATSADGMGTALSGASGRFNGEFQERYP